MVVMDLVDLEHCGFDHEEFTSELLMSGVENKDALWPIAIIVNVGGGHVLLSDTPKDALEKYDQAKRQFDHYVETIKCEAVSA